MDQTIVRSGGHVDQGLLARTLAPQMRGRKK
jgi:hypothetical protein